MSCDGRKGSHRPLDLQQMRPHLTRIESPQTVQRLLVSTSVARTLDVGGLRCGSLLGLVFRSRVRFLPSLLTFALLPPPLALCCRTLHRMCTQKPPRNYSQQLYEKYRESFEEYLTSTVLPSLREKHDGFMLRELVKGWCNHKVIFSYVLLTGPYRVVDDLSPMYRLFCRIPGGLDPVSQILKQHVTVEDTTLVKQTEVAARNKKVGSSTAEVFCSKCVAGSSTAELLDTFCDNILKKGGSQKRSDEATEETLEKVVKLLAYTATKKLARIGGCSLTEVLMMTMKGVTDLTLTWENQSSFEDSLSSDPNANPGIDLTGIVLTTGFWPSIDLNLPAEMDKCTEVFSKLYQTKPKHRKLTWIYSLGTCNIRGMFEAKPIELNVTTYQAAALLLFNALDRLSYSEIMMWLDCFPFLPEGEESRSEQEFSSENLIDLSPVDEK
ncbi:hypothetical protein OPV22_012312 [Ensete ventricosum]|uniref:Cullin family profile domain-containing protein n=1 Tax=Ensete ventricosum TaxID=4639 RepID=A0AAV8R7A2_ENSVE|nr:hypothetical protein OPV22_012312 [Ensete ventricosum]